MRRTIVSAIILTIALSLFARGRTEEPAGTARAVDETRSAAPGGTVSIRAYDGAVTVTGWDRPEVKVSGSLDRDVVRLDFTSTQTETVISVVPPDEKNITSKMRLSCDLEVMVPKGSSIRVSSLSADYTIQGIEGAVDCDTLGGGIDVKDSPGVIGLRTLNGAIRVAGPARRVSFQAMGGARGDDADDKDSVTVTIQGDIPEVMGATLQASVLIQGAVMEDYDISTVSGDITISAALAEGGRLKVDAGLSGSVALTLPPEVEGKFTLSCPLSRVDMEGFRPRADIKWIFRNELESQPAIRVDGGAGAAEGELRVGIEALGRRLDIADLPALSLGTSFSEFDVGGSQKARVYLQLGALGLRSDGAGIVLKTR